MTYIIGGLVLLGAGAVIYMLATDEKPLPYGYDDGHGGVTIGHGDDHTTFSPASTGQSPNYSPNAFMGPQFKTTYVPENGYYGPWLS